MNVSTDRLFISTGQINRAKNQAAGIAPTPPPYVQSRRTFDGGPPLNQTQITAHDLTRKPAYGYGRGRGGYHRGNPAHGGYRVGKPPTHRHRTLVLNGTTAGNFADDAASAPTSASTSASTAVSSPSWVTKNDRHLQLINTSIYQEHADARTKAIEQTRLQQLRQKEHRERNRLMNHLASSGYPSDVSTDSTSAPFNEIMVDGIKFAVVKGGSKLVKLSGTFRLFNHSPLCQFVRSSADSLVDRRCECRKAYPQGCHGRRRQILPYQERQHVSAGSCPGPAVCRPFRRWTTADSGKLQTIRSREQGQRSLQQILNYGYLFLSVPLLVS